MNCHECSGKNCTVCTKLEKAIFLNNYTNFFKDKKYKVKYIVHLKEDFKMSHTTINKEFCGSIEKINDRIYFRLHGSNAIVIVPHDKIEWMAPSKILWDEGYKYEDI